MLDLEKTRQDIAQKKQEIASIRQQINNIRVVVPSRTQDENLALQERQTRAGAEAMMSFDPNTAMNWLQNAENTGIRRDQVQDRSAMNAEKKALQEKAKEEYNQALQAWSANKDDSNARNALYIAMQNLRSNGVSVSDPISQHINEKQGNANLDIRTAESQMKADQEEFNRKMREEGLKLDQASLDLQRAKFYADQQKTAQELASKKGGESLDSTSIAQLSNLQTVLASIEEIKNAFGRFKNSSGLTDKYNSFRDLTGSAMIGSENLGRVQSGGAISGDELKTFKALIAPQTLDYLDGGSSYLNNVEKLKSAIDRKMANFSNKGRSLTGGETPKQGIGVFMQQQSATPKTEIPQLAPR